MDGDSGVLRGAAPETLVALRSEDALKFIE